ncbi:MAG: DUF4832 domain-containing protein [Clostridia bacterium]
MNLISFQHTILFISVFALLVAFIVFKIISYSNPIGYTTELFSESNGPLENPYCGFYHIIGYTLSEEYTNSDNFVYSVKSYTEPLVLIEINLKNYRNSEIGEKGLSMLNDILSAWEQSPKHTKLILRFLYDWDGTAFATEPDSLQTVLKHMEQLSQLVNRYKGTIYIMQGCFIGAWGEMHNSKFANLHSIKTLMNRLNELIDPSIYLSVRTPSLWRGITNLYEVPENFSLSMKENTIAKRLGLFNDGILGSETDLGTYGNTLKKDANSPSHKGIRKEELEFQNRLCLYVPNGGEVIYNSNLSELESAAMALRKMHISYLNADYDSRVLEQWKKSIWNGRDVFNGSDGYSYIKAHLGYRYLIDSCKIKKSMLINKDFTLSIIVKNVGFSNALKPFDVSLSLINEETGDCTTLPFNMDLQSIYGGSKKTFTEKLPVKELKKGNYLIYFSVKDKTSGQTIFLGNKNELTENGYLLGRFEK